MTTLTDPPKEQFRLSMLLYDTRYRSATIQVIAMIGFMLLAAWLISNTAQNLAALGKPIDFGFFSEPASYDINQRLLDYSSRDTHLRAAFIGLLNTLVVAVLGFITATVLGVIIGVLRLSNNWIVARLMTIYVEGFRNVPVLLWIVFIMAILIETLPAPRAFRGDDATASMMLNDSVAVTNRGVYIPDALFSNSLGNVHLFGESSLRFDISLDLMLILIVLGGSLWVSNFLRKRADRIQEQTGDRPVTWWQRLAVVVLPTGLVLVLLGFHLGYPELKGFNFQGGTHLRNSLIALWLALSLYTAAFIAEIVRAGILAISKGQTEAASALGLRSHRPEPRQDAAAGGAAAGAAGDHSAADLELSQPHQELVTGDRRGLHGYHRHAGRYHHEPDRSRAGDDPALDAGVPDHLAVHFGGDELVQ